MKNKSKRTLTPILRFPEFRDKPGWESVSLKDCSVPVDERVGDRILTPVSISAGIGFVPQAEKFGRDISGNQYKLYTLVRDGDFVYNKGNSLKFPQGCVYQLKGWGQVAAPNVFICFRLKKGYSNAFFQNCFEKNVHGSQLRKHITSGARSNGLLNISKEHFFGVKIPTPSPAEQQKIADCLSSLDELIAAEGRKLEAWRAHKKGLMQRLFPGAPASSPAGGKRADGDVGAPSETRPRLRFPEFRKAGVWEDAELGEKVDLLSGYPFDGPDISQDSNGIPLLRGINVTEGRIRHNPEIDRYYTGSTEGLEKFRLQTNDLVIGMDGSKVGKNSALVSEADSGALLIQRVARLRTKKPSLIQFIFQRIHSPSFHSYVDRINTSSGIPHISAKQIKEFRICFPPDAEQQKIASCLTSLDDLIAAQTQKLDSPKTHKRGLMQQLFPSPEEVEA